MHRAGCVRGGTPPSQHLHVLASPEALRVSLSKSFHGAQAPASSSRMSVRRPRSSSSHIPLSSWWPEINLGVIRGAPVIQEICVSNQGQNSNLFLTLGRQLNVSRSEELQTEIHVYFLMLTCVVPLNSLLFYMDLSYCLVFFHFGPWGSHHCFLLGWSANSEFSVMRC